eukprot:m.21076 g.21076  ORF g.21076 m.21076 type:complete len:532 (-) comp7024_c1_seq1:209-1804(-)
MEKNPETTDADATQDTDTREEENKESSEDVEMPSLFSLKKPKDARAGASSALKSLGKGIAAGAATLVAAPIIGAKEQGAVGFVKGLGAGVVGAVTLPIAGAGVAAVQLTRGIANTPESFQQRKKGKFWDQKVRKWVDYDPNKVVAPELPRSKPRGMGRLGPSGGSSGKSNDELYQVLEVSKDATDKEIKKQYYKLAREKHPDKHPDDPDANAQFQKLAHAYQILSDPAKREQYDTYGDDAVDSSSMIDASLFFTMLFGSDRFDHLVGELAMASAARIGDDEVEMRRHQIQRVLKLQENLIARLEIWAKSPEDFLEGAKAESVSLRTTPYGDVFVPTIGKVYETAALEALGGFTGLGASIKSFGRTVSQYYTAAKAASKLMSASQKYEKDQQKKQQQQQEKEHGGEPDGNGEGQEAEEEPNTDTTDTIEQQMEDMIMFENAMSSANVIDVTQTLKEVCNRVLRGGKKYSMEPVPPDVRKQRAEGLIQLGTIFIHSAPGNQKVPATKEEFRDRMQKVAEAVAQKQNEQEEQQS